MSPWELAAKGILRAELSRRHVTYRRLAPRLREVGLNETERSISSKISRGTFSFAFFLQVMKVLNVDTVAIGEVEPLKRLSPLDGAETVKK